MIAFFRYGGDRFEKVGRRLFISKNNWKSLKWESFFFAECQGRCNETKWRHSCDVSDPCGIGMCDEFYQWDVSDDVTNVMNVCYGCYVCDV